MIRTTSTLLALLAAVPAFAQQLVGAQSEIAFTSRQMGVPVDGRFRKFDAQVAFDPKKPEVGTVALRIDLASISMGAPESEAEVVKAPWFDTARFPQATFQSSSIKAAGPGRYEVAGKLGIKGAQRDVVVPVTLAQAGGTTTASGTFVIRRLDFKIGDGEWSDTSMVANDVQVRFKLALTGVAPL
jgi:polyisoprenoid-binding protein YceI